jgi:hypothetical protein
VTRIKYQRRRRRRFGGGIGCGVVDVIGTTSKKTKETRRPEEGRKRGRKERGIS